jgi:O-phosphoseryl-tRNA(Cys) synthetase
VDVNKMAEDTDQRIDSALEDIVNAMNQSKHVKNELKKTIMESVSTLRNIFHALKKGIVDKSDKTLELQIEVNEVRPELQAYRHTRAKAPVSPSIDRLKTPDTYKKDTHNPSSGRKINYADIAGRENKKFKMMITSKVNHTPEATKELIK